MRNWEAAAAEQEDTQEKQQRRNTNISYELGTSQNHLTEDLLHMCKVGNIPILDNKYVRLREVKYNHFKDEDSWLFSTRKLNLIDHSLNSEWLI